LGWNFEAMDPLEWLARLADHIPDLGKHRTHSYGFYASRVRASRTERGVVHQTHPGPSGPEPAGAEKPPPTREVVRVPVDDAGREIQAG
jgi:hypothetical protein